jgi:hypothetical protein
MAAGTTSSSQISPTAPSRLSTKPATDSATTAHAGTLPNTGYDLLPETALGLALVATGVGLRVRRARR